MRGSKSVFDGTGDAEYWLFALEDAFWKKGSYTQLHAFEQRISGTVKAWYDTDIPDQFKHHWLNVRPLFVAYWIQGTRGEDFSDMLSKPLMNTEGGDIRRHSVYKRVVHEFADSSSDVAFDFVWDELENAREDKKKLLRVVLAAWKELGKNEGYASAYDEGYGVGQSHGRDEGRKEGRRLGYDEGVKEGRISGCDEGKEIGYQDGLRVGRRSGFHFGKMQGIQQQKAVLLESDSDSDTNISVQPLPPEILQTVFRYAAAPDLLLNTNRANWKRSSYRFNLRTKQSIIAVCRDWFNAGIDLLYEEVTLWDLAQLSAFISSLETCQQHSLSSFVKSVTINALAVSSENTVLTLYNALQTIIDHCPRLSNLTFTPIPDIDANMTLVPQPNTELLLHIPKETHIRQLNLGAFALPGWGIEIFEQSFDHLETLTLTLNAPLEAPNRLVIPDMIWPHLKWFRFTSCGAMPLMLDIITKAWKMPKLDKLSITVNVEEYDQLVPFLELYGSKLSYLNVARHAASWGTRIDLPLEVVLAQTPALKHLVVSSTNIRHDQEPLSHKTLQWVDIWAGFGPESTVFNTFSIKPIDPTSPLEKTRELFLTSHIPTLQTVRIFDPALRFTRLGLDLPEFLSPDVFSPRDRIQHVGVDIIHLPFKGGYVCQNDMAYLPLDPDDIEEHHGGELEDDPPPGEMNEDSDDSEASWKPHDDVDDGESGSNSDDDDYDTDESATDSLRDALGAKQATIAPHSGHFWN